MISLKQLVRLFPCDNGLCWQYLALRGVICWVFNINKVFAELRVILMSTMNAARSCVFLALFSTCLLYSHGSRLVYHNEASQPDELDLMELIIGEPSTMKRNKQEPKGATNGLWFGPRLGRRKRAAALETREKREIDDSGIQNNENVVRKLMQDEPWALLTFRGNRRSSNFTPRLGRNSEEEIFDNFMDPIYESYARAPTRSGEQTTTHLGPNFTPRLGRIAPLAH